MNVLVAHIPHIIPVVAVWGMMLRFWLAQRRPYPDAPEVAAPSQVRSTAFARPSPAVRRSVAVRGLVALGPVIGALATGLVVYALNLGQGRAGEAAIWTHVGISLLALLLVVYKVADIGLARLREAFTRQRALRSGGSVVLLALWVPLLVSGILLLVFPSQASFTAYTHLIASVWWTGLLLWHLRRYLSRAIRAVLARPSRTGSVAATLPGNNALPPRSRPTQATRRRRSTARELPIVESDAPGVPAEEGACAPISGC